MSTEISYPAFHPEVWGGVECTINRVGNDYRDQLAEAGHYIRPFDVACFGDLAIRKIRYPILWEKHQPTAGRPIDWHWITDSLETLRSQGIEPIAGLLHHGSGPAHTSLLDEAFPEKLAAYAGEVAKQFPWIQYYTPVNEPLTTARFSGLYGYWYPHHTNERSCYQMVFNQVKAIILSMRAIRKVNPEAKLIQTEDLSKVHSTPLLAYQAAFENERRWLTYDLLCGRFNSHHLLWRRCIALGIPLRTLEFFTDNSCAPDIMGFNYYITSERWLDHRLENYPSHFHGGNGRHRYADTDAARAGKREGLGALMQEAWHRYRLPIAVTECHLQCTREEQMRWLQESWNECSLAADAGVVVKALTVWALLGSFDWDSLLLQHNGHYEPGVFDISSGTPRSTALAGMVKSFVQHGYYQHPLLTSKAWWHTDNQGCVDNSVTNFLLIIASGDTGSLEALCSVRNIACRLQTPDVSNLLSADDMPADHHLPWAIIVCNAPHAGTVADISFFSRCALMDIPVLVLTTGSPAEPEMPAEGSWLVVKTGTLSDTENMNHAIDLLIDGETGYWCAEAGTITKQNPEPVTLDY